MPEGKSSTDKPVPLSNEREVTDPITHLPLKIHDAVQVELERIPPAPSTKEEKKLEKERGANTKEESNQRHVDMEDVLHETMDENWWEDPIGDQRRTRIQTAIVAAIAACLASLGAIAIWEVGSIVSPGRGFGWFGIIVAPLACSILGVAVGFAALSVGIFQQAPPQGANNTAKKRVLNKRESSPESARWLNSLLHSLWPIINPSLFTAISDMLEDTMQATLPKLIRGVRVADIGQGAEPIRILGIRWLDPGSAAQEVDGMKAEEGDFINLEVAVAYRGKDTTSQGIRGRSANAHLLLEFYVSGGVVIPVWVELTGLLATARVRIQLTPNPPFLSVMTLTLLGLPKVTMKCTPLAKNFLNVMDVPGLSNWLQASVNLAVKEYVAPRSLTMDLKTMLMGRPKMDTEAMGVVTLTIRRAFGFKSGDESSVFKRGEAKKGDAYVTVCWSKWGKPLWSTRIITSGEPIWEETTAILVTPTELNAGENLKLQLWDSDRFTADDILGTVVVSLKDLMNNKDTLNRIGIREDQLASDDGKPWPGAISWEVGYFEKTSLDQHLELKNQNADELRAKIEREAEEKLREAKSRDDSTADDEVKQQKGEDLKEKTEEIISNSKPTSQWPSGILSIRIEQISGLEVQKIKESGVREDAEEAEAEDLPSAYCTIIVNHQKVYKTRTKMKSNNPFFDAGTERFIRNWKTAEVVISVRDSRLHEVDPVIGVVVLPLREVFKHDSIWSESIPLVGGIGYGRMRVSLLFRSVQLQLPPRLLGWDVGTLDIDPHATASDLPPEYANCRLLLRTMYGKGKLFPHPDGAWTSRRDKPIRLPVKKRYASCLIVQLRKRVRGPDQTPAFCTLWLKDIPDDQEVHLSLPVRKNENKSLSHSSNNATQDIGEHVGTLNVKVRLWPGLSGYHKYMADHDKNMADVMEVLDYAESSQDASKELLEDHDMYADDSSSSSSDDEEEDNKVGQVLERPAQELHDDVKGPFADFRKHQGDLHRKHRGLMQWRAARNVAWIGRGVEHKASKITDAVKNIGKHRTRGEPGLEKEVN